MPNLKTPELISVVIATYNIPGELSLALTGYDLQSRRDFEIVVADDGSGAETADLINQFRMRSDLPIHHVWHPHDGFRKCEILNRAIEAAHGDYLLFTDADCIPRSDFVDVHFREARVSRFLSGSYYNLPESAKNLITEESIRSGEAFQLRWLLRHRVPLSRRCLRLVRNPFVVAALNGLTTTRATWNGCNVSGWKSDLVAVNGYDERMKYGGLDRELGLRLNHAGVKGKQIRYKAICLHVDHPRGYRNDRDMSANLIIRQTTIQQRSDFTPFGIRKSA